VLKIFNTTIKKNYNIFLQQAVLLIMKDLIKINNSLLVMIFFLWAVLFCHNNALATESLTSVKENLVIAANSKKSDIELILDEYSLFEDIPPFNYSQEGRTDPFAPFIKDTTGRAEIETEEEEEAEEMQQYEVGQLTLVAIVLSSKGSSVAMVQDSYGEGHILHEGDKIGRAGVVQKIIANQVLIKQPYATIAGKKKYRTIEMILRKEGDN
jgi:Tfp pilus assembly protein PilP